MDKSHPETVEKEIRSRDGSIASGFKLVRSENGIIGNKVAKTLEFALGSSVVTGTAFIDKKVRSDGSIDLKINVRYNLSDSFEDTIGLKNIKKKSNKILGTKFDENKGLEYGNPYSIVGPSSTISVMSKVFPSKKEYNNFIKGLK